jgi:DNA-binding transcriptional regulator GbsR (MarR family)
MFRIIARERKKREVDPTISVLRESVSKLQDLPPSEGQYEKQQIQSLLGFFETGVDVYKDLEAQNPNSILQLLGTALRIRSKLTT